MKLNRKEKKNEKKETKEKRSLKAYFFEKNIVFSINNNNNNNKIHQIRKQNIKKSNLFDESACVWNKIFANTHTLL